MFEDVMAHLSPEGREALSSLSEDPEIEEVLWAVHRLSKTDRKVIREAAIARHRAVGDPKPEPVKVGYSIWGD